MLNRPRRGRAPLAAIGLLAVLAIAVPIAAGWGTPSPSQSPQASGSPVGLLPSSFEPTPTPTPPITHAPPEPALRRAVVAVTQFRATWTGTTREEVLSVLAGTSKHYAALEMVADDADEILYQLGTTRPADPGRLIEASDAASLTSDLAAHRDRLAFLRADEVSPGVRTLAWEGTSLFGVDRVASLEAWPLAILEAPAVAARRPATEVAYDPAAAWTLVAGGDIMLDRGTALSIKNHGGNVDFPFDGGTAAITGRTCCSSFGWKQPLTRRTGHAGEVRALFESADLAIANFENPAPVNFRFHDEGTVFSANPKLIEGLANVGLDFVSLGNNHIRDAGAVGIAQTIEALDRWGIAHSGAGANLAAARTPAILEAGGVKVAILGYDTRAKAYFATADRAGSAQLTAVTVAEDVAAARAAGADVVIVFPHWGTEYRAQPFAAQRRLGQACIDAGADLVIGNHAHWAGALEIYGGKPIWYALGNFVFDQEWSEPTMEGITLELTFNGRRLVQAVMRPHIIIDKAQPNFLDPAADGAVVMNQVFSASKGTLPW